MFKVAMILEDGRLAGPQVYISLLANALKDKVNTTIVIPIEDSAETIYKLDQFGLQYKTLQITRISKNIRCMIQYLVLFITETAEIYNYFKRNKFDIIYVSGGSWQYKGLIAGKIARIKVIWHMNDTYIPYIFRIVFNILNNLADAFTFASEKTRDYYLPMIKKTKIGYIIPQPVDTSYFSNSSEIESEKIIKKNYNQLIIGTIANINPIKGLEIFIKIVARLNDFFDNLQFIVVGPVFSSQKNYFDKLLNQINNHKLRNIKFVGQQQDIRPFLDEFDIFVCTSYNESGPMTLWEAMSMKKAVVTTNVGDVSKYVHSGFSGEVVNIGDLDTMTQKIKELILDKDKRERYGEKARRIIQHKLDVSICADKHFKLFKRICKNR
jgi:glycosyltransferase involved in cell wall biosynthesis